MIRKAYKKAFMGAFGLLSLSLSLSSCSGSSIVATFYAFDTTCKLNLYNGEGATLDKVEEYLLSLSEKTDNFANHENGYTYQINLDSNEGKAVKVDQDFFDLVSLCLDLEEVTEGYFTPLSGGLSNLWKETINTTKALPSEEDIQSELDAIANTTLTLDEDNLTITKQGSAKLDFGAIAKGYGLDKALEIVKGDNQSQYLLNLGSSSVAFGRYSDDGSFKTYLTDENGESIISLDGIKDISIGVSGSTEQFIRIGDIKYTHIVNPKTGDATAVYDLILLTGNNGSLCDVLATSFMHMDQEKAISIAKQYQLGYLFYKEGNEPIYDLGDEIEVNFL